MKPSNGYSFGTFKGVFTPSILTILGVVMYLRLGWVLGNLGLTTTLILVTLSSSITFFTGLSLAALATNMTVKGGGAYYIISRALGLEAGAAIGLPLYMAQALGISFYIAGFAESVTAVFTWLDPQLIGVTTLLALTALAYLSADLALKSQFLIMLLIGLSLFSFFTGGTPGPEATPTTLPTTPEHLPFWAVFAVFFPAVTGIEAGIAMSGDLKNPERSLPIGTIAAIITGYGVYIAIPIFLSYAGASAELLRADPLVMQKVARWGNLVVLGVWAAALSSALGALLGAPRTLKALADDGVVPRFLGKAYGQRNDPRIATIVSFAIGFAGVMLGDLNMIAPVLSMFFLTSYGALNLSAALEELISPPSWRPKFRISWRVSFLGFLACLCVMLMIDPGATIVAIAVTLSIYYFMKRRSLTSQFGDMRQGLMTFAVRQLLYQIDATKSHARNWQPNILVLSGTPSSRWYLIKLADAISRNRCFLTVVSVFSPAAIDEERATKLSTTIKDYLSKRDVEAFVSTFRAHDHLDGARQLIKAYGFGPLKPNIVMLGETEEARNVDRFVELIQTIVAMKRNMIIVRERFDESECSEEGDEKHDVDQRSCEHRIDVWIKGGANNSPLMIALASLMQRSPEWKGARVVLKRIVDEGTDDQLVREDFEQLTRDQRLKVEIEVLKQSSNDLFQTIRESSSNAEFVILGMRAPFEDESTGEYAQYYRHLLTDTDSLPATALVIAGEDIEFKQLFES